MQDDGKIMLPLKSNSRQPIKIHKNTVIGEGKSLLNAGNVEPGEDFFNEIISSQSSDCTCGIQTEVECQRCPSFEVMFLEIHEKWGKPSGKKNSQLCQVQSKGKATVHQLFSFDK